MNVERYHPKSKPFDPKLEEEMLHIMRHFLTEGASTKEWLYNYLDHPDYLEIILFRNASLEPVGFYIIHCYETDANLVFMKGGVGMIPGYRNQIPRLSVLLRLIKARLHYWRKQLFVFTHIMSPVSYASYGKYLLTFYPHPTRAYPATLVEAVKQARIYFEEPTDIVQEDTTVILSEKELERIHNSKNPYILHYLKLNPDFNNNKALFTLSPFNIRGTFYTIFKVIKSTLKKSK